MKPKLTIVKVGGNIIDDDTKLEALLISFVSIAGYKILVHGGGKLATRLAEQLEIPQEMVDGRRITNAETLKIVTMVYAGWINKSIVARLNALGNLAMGITGADGGIIEAHKRVHPFIDYGFVGDVDAVNTTTIEQWLKQGQSLVVAPITQDKEGRLLNTNADTIAQSLATALSSDYSTTLIYSFDKKGVLQNLQDESSVIPTIDSTSFEALKKKETIHSGMLPKLENAFGAINAGVEKVIIGDATDLNKLVAGEAGTQIIL